MGTISTGIGLISGIDTASLIEQLIAIEGRGKLPLQRRVADLQARQTALLDVNARLLNQKNSAAGFRGNDIFASALAASTNESVLKATASAGALPASYTFIVDRLISTSQQMTRGFASRTAVVGLSELSFELGNGVVEIDTQLEDLNGGGGVRRGIIRITDASGASALIDLSRVGEISEVVSAINQAAAISVTASVKGDGLVLTDTSGGPGMLIVENDGGSFTATDLAIEGNDGGTGTLIGAAISRLALSTALASFNDRNGVLFNSGQDNPDFVITDRNGTAHDIVLGSYDNGSTVEDPVRTAEELINRIDAITGGAVTASIAADGVGLELADNTGGAGMFSVSGAGIHGDRTADDLGILNAGVAGDVITGRRVVAGLNSVLLRSLNGGAGVLAFGGSGTGVLSGSTLLNNLFQGVGISSNGNPSSPDMELQDRNGNAYEVEIDTLTTVQDLIDAVDNASGGTITLEINGNALRAVNHSLGLLNFRIQDINGSTAIAELGLTADYTILDGDVVDGVDTQPAGPGGTTLQITNRNGDVSSVDLTSAASLSDVIELINTAGAGVSASLNDARNGLLITDTTGGAGSLIIGGDAADDLRLSTGSDGVAANTFRGINLQLQYVSGATDLADLNHGRGVAPGSFRITDADGDQAIIDIGSDSTILQDIINEINSTGLDILARVNDRGDGLLIESTSATGSLTIRVEGVSGSTARDLRILGEAEDPIAANFIDGSYERTVRFEEGDTLETIVSKINEADLPVAASIIDTGAGPSPVRITFTSELTGRAGDLSIDAHGFDAGLTVLSRGLDARVFYGSSNPAEGLLLRSGTNTLDDVIENVRIDLVSADTAPVTVTVSRDTDSIVDAARDFVITFNDVVGRINDYDTYNPETEERGILLGDPTVARVHTALFRILNSRAIGVDGPYQFLSQVGIRAGAGGELQFDEGRFRAALEDDPQAVADLFIAFEKSTEQETLPGGIETGNTIETFDSLGIAEQFARLLEGLTNAANGTMTLADENLERLIELTQDRIERFDERLEARRERLQREFAAMEDALALLQAQQSALGAIANNVLLAGLGGMLGIRG